jgi:hypothetical protein
MNTLTKEKVNHADKKRAWLSQIKTNRRASLK